jgi:DNA polymerase III subunit gamma/tau
VQAEPTPAPEPPAAPAAAEPTPEPPAAPAAAEPAPEPEPAPAPEPVPTGGLSLVDVRRLWPDIVDATKMRRRLAWMHLTQNCQVVAVDATTLTLGFANAGARDSFVSGGCDEVLRQAAIDVVGASWKIETIVDPGAQAEGTPTVTRAAVPEPPPEPAPEHAAEATPEPAPKPASEASAAAREAIQQTRQADQAKAEAGPDWAAADADAHPDDLDAEHQGLSTAELLQRELGAQMIEEIRHQ